MGPIQYGRGNHQVFLGRDFGEERNYSEEIASKIDAEVRRIIETCYEHGRRFSTDNWDKVERMVASLLEYETVEAEEVRAILDGQARTIATTRAARAAADRNARARSEEPKRPRSRAYSAEDLAGAGMKSAVLCRSGARCIVALRPRCAAIERASGALPHGGTYVRRTRSGASPVAAIDLWFRAPGRGYDNAVPGVCARRRNGGRCGATLVSGRSLGDTRAQRRRPADDLRSIPTSSASARRSRIRMRGAR